MAEILTQAALERFISNYGVLAVFLGMILEEVLFVIPASLIIVSAGALMVESTALIPALSEIFFEITLIGSLGITAGSFFVYGIGFYGGKPAVNKVGGRAGFSWEDVKRFESHFTSEREKEYLLLFRILPIFPITTVSAAAGLFRMNWKNYSVITFLGMFPRHFFYAYLGWKAQENYGMILAKIGQFSEALTLTGIVALTAYLIYRKGEGLKHEVQKLL